MCRAVSAAVTRARSIETCFHLQLGLNFILINLQHFIGTNSILLLFYVIHEALDFRRLRLCLFCA
jgi:hypothetical protein